MFTHKSPVHADERGLTLYRRLLYVGASLLAKAVAVATDEVRQPSIREQARSYIDQKWKLVLSNAVRPAAWLAKWVEKALS